MYFSNLEVTIAAQRLAICTAWNWVESDHIRDDLKVRGDSGGWQGRHHLAAGLMIDGDLALARPTSGSEIGYR